MKKASLRSQQGITLFGLLIVLMIIGLILVLAAKVIPAVIEYNSIKKAVASVQLQGGTVNDMRAAFDRQADVGYISTLSGNDLVFSKENSKNVLTVSFAYEKKIDLFTNVYLLIDFAGTAGDPDSK